MEKINSLFNEKSIPKDARELLENFDQLVQSSFPANSKQLLLLPKQIRELSHQMTDERGSRRLGYMNDKIYLACYARYFLWWNLVRMTRLFSNIDFSFLKDGSVCADLGSGPLTVITALWLSRPDLRQKKITWYAVDISQQSLNLGEEIFLSVAAKTSTENSSIWKIIKVRGQLGLPLKEKLDFVSCANVFNEVLQNQDNPPDFLAKKYSKILFNYLNKDSSILLIEPGVPKSARFVSLMRDCFLRSGFSIVSPCPHSGPCPMDGRRMGQSGASGKWCNFAFNTDSCPKRLLALSKKAELPKERAVLSFVLASKAAQGTPGIRIVSDVIWVPLREGQKKRAGHYACAKEGFSLAVSSSGMVVDSGDLVEEKKAPALRQRDAKTGAIIVEI